MQTINTIRELLDEIPTLSEISKDLPFPYNTIINQKIKEFTIYLEEIHTKELDRWNAQFSTGIFEELNKIFSSENQPKH